MVVQSLALTEWIAAQDDLRGWMASAASGANFLLYVGIVLPQLNPVVRAAKAFVADGFATLHLGPNPEGGRRWTLQRTAKVQRARVAGVALPPRSDLDHDAARVLALLERAAGDGALCPRLDDMATACLLRVGAVRAALGRLEARGLIRIETYWATFSRCARVVTLLETGARTAAPSAGYRAWTSRAVLNYEGAMPQYRAGGAA